MNYEFMKNKRFKRVIIILFGSDLGGPQTG